MNDVVIGVDVGTGSARAGVFNPQGRLLAAARHPIHIWHDHGDRVEQSSADIWQACVSSIRSAVTDAGVRPEQVRGLGFDATCSLVVIGADGAPLPVGHSGDPARNVIVWMDHRAAAQAREINREGHAVLAYVGGAISPEMQVPKLAWLKAHMPATFSAAEHFFDLSDFLTWRATGSLARSTCTVTCKWTYLAHENRWDDGFFRAIGLDDLLADGHRRIGAHIVPPGSAIGHGLTAPAAAELGLLPETPVAASLIDAHAGAVGTMGTAHGGAGVLAYIMGTSSCIMASTTQPAFVPGIWGPYFSALVAGAWLNEGGQSAAGAAIDQLVRSHAAFPDVAAEAHGAGVDVLEHLEQSLVARAGSLEKAVLAARNVHVLPDLLGNRSPFADPEVRGGIAGLRLDATRESLEQVYVATLCGLGYGTAEIIDALVHSGVHCEALVISGGASRSPLVRRVMADATGIPVLIPATPEPVLLGSAMLGAVAGGVYPALPVAMSAMSSTAARVEPSGGSAARFHQAKRRVFALQRTLDRESRMIMVDAV